MFKFEQELPYAVKVMEKIDTSQVLALKELGYGQSCYAIDSMHKREMAYRTKDLRLIDKNTARLVSTVVGGRLVNLSINEASEWAIMMEPIRNLKIYYILKRVSPKIFGGRRKRKVFIESLNKARMKASINLQNPRLRQIHYHTLRHWKGTTEYHKTHDIMHVKQVLGHKNIESTMVYINIEQVIFEETPEEFHVKATSDPQEIKELLEVGFQYVCENDGLMFFRKRK